MVPPPAKTELWSFHKPVGCTVSRSDEQGRQTVFDLLPKDHRGLIAVGRLDLASEGLLLFTNDGDLARYLELPRTGLERTYRARVFGHLSTIDRKRLAAGLTVDGQKFGPVRVSGYQGTQQNSSTMRSAANHWLEVRLNEGRNREVRRALGAVGLQVSRLIRTGYGPFTLGDLPQRGLIPVENWQAALDWQAES